MPPSTLHRLFTFAKATKAEALENFTTEALAAAITDDPTPLLAALARVPGLRVPPTARLLRVATQVPVDGGSVDLVVTFDTITYWFEVKAHGGLHGDQLATYRRAIADDTSGDDITLLLLSKHPLEPEPPTLRWNHLRASILDAGHTRGYWHDLLRFLEERQMADAYDEAVLAHELAGMSFAYALLRKVDRIAETLLDGFDFPAAADPEFASNRAGRRRELGQQFRKHGRLVVSSGLYPWIVFGVIDRDGKPNLALWIRTNARHFDARKRVHALARGGGLAATWDLGAVGPGDLCITREIAAGIEHDDAVAWLRARMTALNTAGILSALPEFRRAPAAEPADEVDAES
jgi:hypothetical protein